MAKYGIVREMSIHGVEFDLGEVTPIVPPKGVFIRFRATQANDEAPDIEDRPLDKGESLLLISRLQAEGLIRTLEEALTRLED